MSEAVGSITTEDYFVDIPELEGTGLTEAHFAQRGVHLTALETPRPIMVIGDVVLHGQYQEVVGTSVVVACPSASADGTAEAARVVAVTSKRLVFRFATPDGCETLVRALANKASSTERGSSRPSSEAGRADETINDGIE